MIGPPAGADESTRLSNPGPAGRRDAPEDHRVVGETPLSDS